MAVVTSDLLLNIESGIRTNFFGTYERYPFQYDKVSVTVNSQKYREYYGWMGQDPHVREWIGSRQDRGLQAFEYILKNRKWEQTLPVSREAIEDDQTGQVMLRAKQLGETAARDKERYFWETLEDGQTNNCYDGTPFLGALHNESVKNGGGLQANMFDLAFNPSNVGTLYQNMRQIKDNTNFPINIVPDTLIVGPQNSIAAMELANSTFFPELMTQANPVKLATNVFKGIFNILVVPYFTDQSLWGLACTTGIIRPMLLQQRTPLEVSAQMDPNNSHDVFYRDEYVFGTRERYEVGYGDWKYIAMSTP